VSSENEGQAVTARQGHGASTTAELESRDVAVEAPLFIVLNVGSGKHGDEDVRGAIEAALFEAGRTYFFHEVGNPEDLAPVARNVVDQARASGGVVVAAGGDGTINTVAAATLGSGCAFGVIPLGTFNYFSRTHGIPSDVKEACEILIRARAWEVQVGLVNDRVFLVNASIGLYPKLLEEREEAKQKLGRSRWVAAGAALRTLLRPHRALSIEVESKQVKRRVATPTLFVGNNRLQLEQVGLRESELVERHRLAAVVLEPVSIWQMTRLVVRALLGRLAEEETVISFGFERMVVRPRFGRRSFKVATDGEVCFVQAPLTFRIAEHSLLLLRPEEVGEDPG
jgi:diacylglycerol kinase family enzyme